MRAVQGLTATAAALVMATGCAEIDRAVPEEAVRLAELRADLEQDNALVAYQIVRKQEASRRGENPDRYDDAEALRGEARFKERWAAARKAKFEAVQEGYKGLSTDVVRKCVIRARTLVQQNNRIIAGNVALRERMAKGEPSCEANPAVKPCVPAFDLVPDGGEQVDACVKSTPEAAYDPIKTLGIAALVLVLGVAGVGLYRSARRRIDPVAQAGQKLGLAAVQSPQTTTLSGEYKGYAIKVEASAPEVGHGDGFLRAIVLSKVHPHAIVRFGPLAPPTGLDLPHLDAPESPDPRLPEGYKLRLSPGASAEELLSGDVGFQMRAFDPADLRLHDGMLGLTCWQVPPTADKVIEFLDLAVAAARLYPPA